MLQPTVRRTWAPSGQTPLLVPSAKHDRWSIITALTVSPDRQRLGLYFQGFAENITGEHCELFVWAIHQQVRRPLLVVWDGLSAHATAANALQDCGDRILFERFPAYSRSSTRSSSSGATPSTARWRTSARSTSRSSATASRTRFSKLDVSNDSSGRSSITPTSRWTSRRSIRRRKGQ
ncbi:MAG: transposase [Sandaracinaceae bacterium]|nr:transposase [Sandaracinaceae bacterium]